MRYILGIIVGFLLAIGVAYLHDAQFGLYSVDHTADRVVNWTVLGNGAQNVVDTVHAGWNKITGKTSAPAPAPAP